MPLDAICLAALREELAARITGMKIDKVQQPERDTVILSLRGSGATDRLLISAGSGDSRMHLTNYSFENPASPPMFCMLLRKHLNGAKIAGITHPRSERVLELELEAPNAMGVLSEKRLTVELIGRMSNIILIDCDGIIIDCLRRIGGELSDKRGVLPGLLYRPPPAQPGKIDPFSVTDGEWSRLFNDASGKTVDKWLLTTFTALSPLICRELSWRAYGVTDIRAERTGDGGTALRREFFTLLEQSQTGGSIPWLISKPDNTPQDYSYTRIMHYENACYVRREESFSTLLDYFHTRAAQLSRLRQRAAATAKTITTARDRLARKLALQRAELDKTSQRDKLRECGDIIMANLHVMNKGQRVLISQDFFSADSGKISTNSGDREIALDPLKTPQQNAAKYYKDYKKAKNAQKYLTEQIESGESELAYLESVLEEIALAEGERDLSVIRDELTQTGYIRALKQGKEKRGESAPLAFVSSGGIKIQAGRNNIQNDKLTLKTASKSDIWLHVQKAHGAHVIVSCQNTPPDKTTLYEAAMIAAYYSSSRSEGKVPVDYTTVRHVRKPEGGRPGMVIYTDYKTIIATPDKGQIEKLEQR